MKRVLILADHIYVVHSIRLTLRQATGFQVVAVADGRDDARAQLAHHSPDVVLVDEMSDSGDAFARLREIRAELPAARCLLLTQSKDDDVLEDAFEAGADAVICKSVQPAALGTLLREICNDNVRQRFQTRRATPALEPCPLTNRELEIVRLVAEGYTNNRIARELWVTEQTVKFHLSNAYRKLGVANRAEATRYAYQHRLVDDDPIAPAESGLARSAA